MKTKAAAAMWAQEVVDEMISLAQAKTHSCAMIADALNAKFSTSYTRSAIAGKLHRLGVSTQKEEPKKKAVVAKPAPRPPRPLSSPVLQPVEDIALAPSPDALNVTMMQLEKRMCKWPTDTDLYCGRHTEFGQSYCNVHRKAGTMPARYSVRQLVGRIRR